MKVPLLECRNLRGPHLEHRILNTMKYISFGSLGTEQWQTALDHSIFTLPYTTRTVNYSSW